MFPCWYGRATVNRPFAGSIPAATAQTRMSSFAPRKTALSRSERRLWKSSGWMRSLSRKQVAASESLASSSLAASARCKDKWSRGQAAKAALLQSDERWFDSIRDYLPTRAQALPVHAVPRGSASLGDKDEAEPRRRVFPGGAWEQESNYCPRGAARSARRPVTAEVVGSNPIGDAETLCVGWALARLSGCNPPAFGLCRFDSCPAHFCDLAK